MSQCALMRSVEVSRHLAGVWNRWTRWLIVASKVAHALLRRINYCHRLQSNSDKAEVLWCASNLRQHQTIFHLNANRPHCCRHGEIRPWSEHVYRRRPGHTSNNSIAIFRRTPSDPPFGAASYFPVTCGYVDAIKPRLRKHRTDRPFVYNRCSMSQPVWFTIRSADHITDALIRNWHMPI